MKLRLGGTFFETVGPFVRITNGAGTVVSDERPSAMDTLSMLRKHQGYEPNNAQRISCSRIAAAAREEE